MAEIIPQQLAAGNNAGAPAKAISLEEKLFPGGWKALFNPPRYTSNEKYGWNKEWYIRELLHYGVDLPIYALLLGGFKFLNFFLGKSEKQK
ncbi:MAG: hypothetical protein LBK26_04030 [Rickettsiales bacterium]|jgi:hypothetical protein|nr:hypothetical protein [Rickettsiales bacterium]